MADILAVTSSDTLALRLRLLVEAEGGTVEVVATAEEARHVAAAMAPRAIVVAPGTEEVGTWAGAVPVIAVDDDWASMRRRLAGLLADGAGSEAAELAAALARCRLLLVDDSVTYRGFLRHELERVGVAVTVCGAAQDALVAVGRQRFDAIMIDLVMPGMDGAELCSRLAALRRRERGSFILAALSSRGGGEVMAHALEAGADLFLAKDQDMATLLARLGAALRFKDLSDAAR